MPTKLQTQADVRGWLAAHSLDDLKELAAGSSRFNCTFGTRDMARQYLADLQNEPELRRRDEELDLLRRQTVAAEDSAAAAKKAAHWAIWSAIVAVVAAVVAAASASWLR